MALDFPNSPTIGDEFTGGGFTWVWTGDSWDKVMASVATGGNGFSLLVGATGNTTYAFATPQPAGFYTITSSENDTTFDIYLVTAANANAGYTNTLILEATAEFDRVVVYGATTNDVLNFEYKPSSAPVTSGDVADGAAPFLTSATPTTLESIDDTTTVTGGNFASDVEIVFTGQDAVDRPAKNIVRSSSTSLIVTRPDVFPVEQEPYSMTATNAGIPNPSVVVNKLTNYFDAGGGITWVTDSALPAALPSSPYSTTLEATDADGTSVGYAITSGSLQTGLSLNSSTGVISGTTEVSEVQTFTVTATDAGGNSSAREFTLSSVSPVIEYLVIAGGGGGGANNAAGGGAGGYRSSISGESSGGGASAEAALTLETGTNYTVTVGAGGAGGPSINTLGSNGQNSVFATITSIGGGGGATAGSSTAAGTGGSGGGASFGAAGLGTSGQGFAGGASTPKPGGGGGAGGVGQISSGVVAGAGGIGVASSVLGSSVYRAGGGGGGSDSSDGASGVGGTGMAGGGDGGTQGANGQEGSPNSGGGGGGGGWVGVGNGLGGPGGSGLVVIRYNQGLNVTVGAGLSSYTLIDGTSKVTVFTSGSDSISFNVASAGVTPVEFLVVAGGGGSAEIGGGGGAGGYLSSVSGESSGGGTLAMLPLALLPSTNYSVTIGAGGAGLGGAPSGENGINSSISGLVAFGGGGGASPDNATSFGKQGGSGGADGRTPTKVGPGVVGQGFKGGRGGGLATSFGGGGGGGGAAAIGGSWVSNTSGSGGVGVISAILPWETAFSTSVGEVIGTSVYFAGGGGGGAYNGTPGTGGNGGGGDGRGGLGVAGIPGLPNTGGGGGGGSASGGTPGGNGGSGVAILRYPATKTLTVGAGLTSSTTTIGANKVTVLTAGTGTVSLS